MRIRTEVHVLGILMATALPVGATGSVKPYDIVLVGHSLVNHNLPQMLRKLGPANSTTQEQVINGAPMIWNWEHSHKAEGINARAMLTRGDIDVLIVTEAIPLQNHITWNDSYGHALRWRNAAVDANPDARTYLYETWHELDLNGVDGRKDGGPRDLAAWRMQLSADLPKWEEIARRGRMTGLVPAGQAMASLYDAIQAGKAADLTSIAQLFSDDIHLNDLGNYFIACVQYAVIYGTSPVGLPHQLVNQWDKPYKPPSEALALRMQQIAWDVVSRHRLQDL